MGVFGAVIMKDMPPQMGIFMGASTFFAGLFFFFSGMRMSRKKEIIQMEKVRVTEKEKQTSSFIRFLQVFAAIATIIGTVIAVMSFMGNN